MPVEIARNGDGTVAVAYCFGKLTATDVSDSVNVAFSARGIEPGMDRIVTIDPAAGLQDLDIDALRRIQRRILDQELQDGGEAAFRSVLVHSSPMQMRLLRLYKAIWDALNLPGVEFFVVESEDEGWEILGSVPG